MAVIYDIEHVTSYRYANPVTLSQHRAMFLPRAGHGGRILSHSLETNVPSKVRWVVDALSNSLALIDFSEPLTELVVTYKFRALHYGTGELEDCPIDPRGQRFPVQYAPDEWTDLAPFMRPHSEDPDGSVAAWARGVLAEGGGDTAKVLKRFMNLFGETFTYQSRYSEGTQTPSKTLSTKKGACRDFAWLMIEALRQLGVACRFISGYLYDASLDTGGANVAGSASTHAWVAVYLPGAGWHQYDPTNQINKGFELIPVASARHPGQASPLKGSWYGSAADYLGMDVKVSIHKIADIYDDR